MGAKSVIKSGYPYKDSFVFEFQSETEAGGVFACDTKLVLCILEKWGASSAVVRIAGQSDLCVPIATIRLMQEFEPLVQILFADTSLPPVVLKAAAQKSEEEGLWGIVRLSDERQVIMSGGMAGMLRSGVGINETTNWRRPEFWHLGDLEELVGIGADGWTRKAMMRSNTATEFTNLAQTILGNGTEAVTGC